MGGIEGLGTTVPEASHQQQQTAGRRKLAPGDSARSVPQRDDGYSITLHG